MSRVWLQSAAPWAILLAWGAAGLCGETGRSDGSTPSTPTTFSWRASYAEALDAANTARTPLLVYFPPVTEPDPAAIARAARVLGSPPRAQGVRVGADEVRGLVERFDVQDVPSLLLLDRSERVVSRWTGAIPSSAWRLIDSAIRALERRELEYRKILDGAQKELAAGDAESAYQRVAGLLDVEGAPRDVVEEARRVEQGLQEQVWRKVLAVLAGERLVEDSQLVAGLAEIRDSTRHPGLREAILSEIGRVQAGVVLGSPEGVRPLRALPDGEPVGSRLPGEPEGP